MTERTDPLAGANPAPREQLDRLPLHEARRQLLGEIMSTSGLGSPRPPRARLTLLLPVAAAAVLVLLAGGLWLVATGGSDDPPPVAGSGGATSATSATSAATTATTAPRDPSRVSARACTRLRKADRWVSVYVGERGLSDTLAKHLKDLRGKRYVRTRAGRWVEIDGQRCRYLLKGDPALAELRKLRLGPSRKGRGPEVVILPPSA